MVEPVWCPAASGLGSASAAGPAGPVAHTMEVWRPSTATSTLTTLLTLLALLLRGAGGSREQEREGRRSWEGGSGSREWWEDGRREWEQGWREQEHHGKGGWSAAPPASTPAKACSRGELVLTSVKYLQCRRRAAEQV